MSGAINPYGSLRADQTCNEVYPYEQAILECLLVAYCYRDAAPGARTVTSPIFFDGDHADNTNRISQVLSAQLLLYGRGEQSQ